MMARGVRFSDVFVAGPRPTARRIDVTVGGVPVRLNGVWRRILYIPRGIGGKHVTALDVTGPGPYTARALDTLGPIPLWSRGNPDTVDGTTSGANNATAADRPAYSAMGQTWSLPTVAYGDKSANTAAAYTTPRRPDGVDYAIFMGSGYGATGEGTTFYTLDALSGDVLAAVDVEIAAQANGLPEERPGVRQRARGQRGGLQPVGLRRSAQRSPGRLGPGADVHRRPPRPVLEVPHQGPRHRDPHRRPRRGPAGRDRGLGPGLPPTLDPAAPATPVPFVFVSSGNDRRAEGPFKNFAFRDDSTDDEVPVGSGVVDNEVTTFPPAVSLHTRQYDQGAAEANCGYTEEAYFRGTIQPATAFDCGPQVPGTSSAARTRSGASSSAGPGSTCPNTRFAPSTLLACSQGDYPCRSPFDSIIYALGCEVRHRRLRPQRQHRRRLPHLPRCRIPPSPCWAIPTPPAAAAASTRTRG